MQTEFKFAEMGPVRGLKHIRDTFFRLVSLTFWRPKISPGRKKSGFCDFGNANFSAENVPDRGLGPTAQLFLMDFFPSINRSARAIKRKKIHQKWFRLTLQLKNAPLHGPHLYPDPGTSISVPIQTLKTRATDGVSNFRSDRTL